jgi:23S rRNA pseudouridine2605 synthase
VDEKVRRPQKGSRSNAKTRTPEALQLEVPQELRLSRFLSMAGVASRRAAEQLILDGKVKVNGYVVKTLGTKINPKSDRVEVEGKPASADRALVVILLNKPKGCICSRKDPEGRESVYDILGAAGKGLFSIGRLDYNSEGVILFTNDGNLAQALMHPSASVKRVYRVRIRGLVDPQLGRRLLEGVESEGEMLSVEEAWVDGQTKTHTWVSVVLREGKNRHLRRMFEALGYTVARLVRVQYAALDTGDLDPGRWRQLSPGELKGITALAAAANQAPASH